MKKNWLMIITILMSFWCFSNVAALQTSDAKEGMDSSKNITLTLTYHYDDLLLNDVLVNVYHIASLTDDFKYQLMPDFTKYPIAVNGLNNQQEWDMLEETLKSYIRADDIGESFSGAISNNQLRLTNLPVGLYLIETEMVDEDKYTLKYDEILINLPQLLANGKWNYEVNVYPKGFEYIPKYEEIKYAVIKQWQDDGKNRPDSVNIEIYKNDELIEEKTLSSSNNWTYEWIGLDDGSKWNVVERNIPNGYKVSISKKENIFIILNSYINYEENNPQTGDNINLYLYLFLGSFMSLIIIIINFLKRKKT